MRENTNKFSIPKNASKMRKIYLFSFVGFFTPREFLAFNNKWYLAETLFCRKVHQLRDDVAAAGFTHTKKIY